MIDALSLVREDYQNSGCNYRVLLSILDSNGFGVCSSIPSFNEFYKGYEKDSGNPAWNPANFQWSEEAKHVVDCLDSAVHCLNETLEKRPLDLQKLENTLIEIHYMCNPGDKATAEFITFCIEEIYLRAKFLPYFGLDILPYEIKNDPSEILKDIRAHRKEHLDGCLSV
ncbi:MAG: hypothetical protein ABIJ08_02350 [Nanoarchaeota archaeon]